MSKVVLFAASLLLVAGIATAGIINPCNSPVGYHGVLPECYFACPQGDTPGFGAEGFWFDFIIRDLTGSGIPFIPGTDFWVIDCDPLKDLALCGGSASSNADSATNSAGKTTMYLTSLAAGGCADGLSPVVQGYVLGSPPPVPCPVYCFNVRVRSCDLTGDLIINIADLGLFATYYPPNPYNKCGDFDCNGVVNIADLARLAFHYGPPGHKCV